jgi:hypothetical protein
MRENSWKNHGKSSKHDEYHKKKLKRRLMTYKILQKQNFYGRDTERGRWYQSIDMGSPSGRHNSSFLKENNEYLKDPKKK